MSDYTNVAIINFTEVFESIQTFEDHLEQKYPGCEYSVSSCNAPGIYRIYTVHDTTYSENDSEYVSFIMTNNWYK